MSALNTALPRASRLAVHRRVALAMVVVPALGTLAALVMAWHVGWPGAVALWLFLAFYLASAIGVEIGFHRYFTHRAFKCGPTLRLVLAAFGSMAGEGPVLFWAATHRRHHSHSDTDQDPHGRTSRDSPGSGARMSAGCSSRNRRTPDATYPISSATGRPRWRTGSICCGSRWASRCRPRSASRLTAGLARSRDCLWGGMVRIFVAHQATWSINSMCHLFGARPYDTHDDSRNFWPLALPTLGGAWHNNHHAFPRSAFNDFTWWQVGPVGLADPIGGSAGAWCGTCAGRSPDRCMETKRHEHERHQKHRRL
jgi:stearoyl-CoA desaturase (delta-9 desaturase)